MNPVVPLVWDQAKEGWAPQRGIADNLLSWLSRMDKTAIQRGEIDHVRALGKLWIGDVVANQAIRANRHFKCEIGHDRFSKAAEAWWTLTGERPKRDTPLQPTIAVPLVAA